MLTRSAPVPAPEPALEPAPEPAPVPKGWRNGEDPIASLLGKNTTNTVLFRCSWNLLRNPLRSRLRYLLQTPLTRSGTRSGTCSGTRSETRSSTQGLETPSLRCWGKMRHTRGSGLRVLGFRVCLQKRDPELRACRICAFIGFGSWLYGFKFCVRTCTRYKA